MYINIYIYIYIYDTLETMLVVHEANRNKAQRNPNSTIH